MTRKQMVIIALSIILLIAITFGIVKLTDKQDREENAVEDIQEEQDENKKEIDSTVEDVLGITEKILTKNEMEKVIEEWKEADPELFGSKIEDKIVEEFGELNRRAYLFGYLAEDTDTEFERMQMVHQLLAVSSSLDLDVIGGKQFLVYMNPLDGSEYIKEANRVIAPYEGHGVKDFLYVKDTEGFTEIDGIYVGYPRIAMSSLYVQAEEMIEDKDLPRTIDFEIDIHIKETTKVKDAIEKYTDLPIEINGVKVLPPYGSVDKETYGEYMRDMWDFSEEEIKESYEVNSKLKGLESFVTSGMGITDNYIDDVNNRMTKSFLKNGILTVSYEVPIEAVIEGHEYGTDYFDYLDEDETVKVTMGEVEFDLELLTDELQNLGIYYRE